MDQGKTSLKPNILIAPLDWGLGHATRCIPIIRHLIQRNCNVIIAGEGKVQSLLQLEFPQLSFLHLKGYNIMYSKNKWTLPFVMVEQISKILSAIQYENERLKAIVEEHTIDGIISDNRYGFYHEKIPSIFITHQLLIRTGFGKMADDFLQKLNYSYLHKFSECWVPDNEGLNNLAGALSHPEQMPSLPIKFLGPLSRFAQKEVFEKHVLLLLSGPEPQRTILEELLIEQIQHYKNPVVLVRGLPNENAVLQLPSNVFVYNHLSANELNQKMAEASLVISRCGYSTIMDLAAMKKKSILIPTPGQTEQEYLAKHLMQNNFALCVGQNKFRLKQALELSASFPYKLDAFTNENKLEPVLENFVSQIAS